MAATPGDELRRFQRPVLVWCRTCREYRILLLLGMPEHLQGSLARGVKTCPICEAKGTG